MLTKPILGISRQIDVVVSNQFDLPSVSPLPAVSAPIFDVSYPGCWTTGEGVRDMVGVLVTGSGDPESLGRSNAVLEWSRWSDISASKRGKVEILGLIAVTQRPFNSRKQHLA